MIGRNVYIYALCHPETGACFYVGQTVNLKNRESYHRYRTYRDRKFIMIHLATAYTKQEASRKEKFWITQMILDGESLENVSCVDPLIGIRFEIPETGELLLTEADLQARVGYSIDSLKRFVAYQDSNGYFTLYDQRNNWREITVIDRAKAPNLALRAKPKPFAFCN